MDIPDLLGWEWPAAQEFCVALGLTVNAVPTEYQRYQPIAPSLPDLDSQWEGPPWRVIRQRITGENQIELVVCAEKWQLDLPDTRK